MGQNQPIRTKDSMGQLHFSGRYFSEGKSTWGKVSKASIRGARERGEKKEK